MADPISILESAYQLGHDERTWMRDLVEVTAPFLDRGHGVHAWTFDASRSDTVGVRTFVNAGVDERVITSLFRVEFPGALRPRLQRMFRRGAACTLLRAIQQLRGQTPYFKRALAELGLADVRIVNAVDPTHLGCFIVAPSQVRCAFQPRESHRWRHIASHLATAFRIRRLAESRTLLHGQGLEVEAVLRPDGRIEHAEGPARASGTRAALTRATSAIDRARGSLRLEDPDEAISIWRALVSGRWSLVDHYDSDGRRYVLAHRNPAAVPDRRGLTLRERQVLAYADLGHSNKLIAYELGISLSTVAGHLARARAKIALPSATALYRRVRSD